MYERTGCLSCGASKAKRTPQCKKEKCPKTLGSYLRWALDLPMTLISEQRSLIDQNMALKERLKMAREDKLSRLVELRSKRIPCQNSQNQYAQEECASNRCHKATAEPVVAWGDSKRRELDRKQRSTNDGDLNDNLKATNDASGDNLRKKKNIFAWSNRISQETHFITCF